MKLIYQLNPADLVTFNEYHSAHSDLHIKQRRKHRIIVPIVYLVLAALILMTGARIGAVFFSFFAVLWFLLSPSWLRRRYRKHFQKHVAETVGDSLRDPIILELQDDGIHSQSYVGQSV
jgi:Flp pilus assembly protein TadB